MNLHFFDRCPAASLSIAGRPAASTATSIAVKIAACSIRLNMGQTCRQLAGIILYNLARRLSFCGGPSRLFNGCVELDFDFF